MFKGKWTEEYNRLSEKDYSTRKPPTLIPASNVVILPARESPEHAWGSGGAIDGKGQLIEASRMGSLFGESYRFDESEVSTLNETVYYIPVIPKHWGHFLIDILCRFWFLTDKKDRGYRIAYCAQDFGEEGVTGNYLEALELLGVTRERLLFITKPTRLSEILIPEKSFGDGEAFSNEYCRIIDLIKRQVFQEAAGWQFPKIEKRIYFTRTQFRRSKYTEVGEKRIESLFRERGFTVLAPETLTVRDQVFYFSTCKEIASLSGTISHNIVFSEPGNQYILLNRCCLPNYAQFAVNQMSPAEVTYVDVYAKETTWRPKFWPVWIEPNQYLEALFMDMGFPPIEEKTVQRTCYYIENLVHYCYMIVRLKLKDLYYSWKSKANDRLFKRM